MPTCDHSYTRVSGMKFRCVAKPHPAKPDSHYFVRDLVAEERARRQRKQALTLIPGERR